MKVYLTDLTSRFPQYTSVLAKYLKKQNTVDFSLLVAGISNFHYSYFEDYTDIFIDVRNKVLFEHTRDKSLWKRTIKFVEYLINDIIFKKYINRTKPDLIHFQYFPLIEFFPRYEINKIQLLRRKGIKIIYTVHNVLPNNEKAEHLKSNYQKLYNMVDHLIVHTVESKRRISNQFNIREDKINIIPHGYLGEDLEDYKKDIARDALDLHRNRKYVLFFGGINKYKGIEFLLDAWKQIEQDNITLIIVGAGPSSYLDHIQSLISDNNISNVKTHFEFVSDDILAKYIAASDLIVYPYKSITQSGALFLGMGKGKAVITTNLAGFKEVIEPGVDGEMVEFDAFQNLSDKILKLLKDDRLLKKYGDNARKKMTEQYSWDTISRDTIRVYKEVFKS